MKWKSLLRLLRFWRRLFPVRVIIRVYMMLLSICSNVQAQQSQIENMYARLRYNFNFLREREDGREEAVTEGN